MTVDAIALLGENRFGVSVAPEQFLARATSNGIDGALVAPARPRGYHLPPANAALGADCRRSDGRLYLLARVDPTERDARDQVVQAVEEFGAVGIFVHPLEESFPITTAGPVFDAAADCSVPIIVAAGYVGLSEALQVSEMALRYPSLPIVMTSAGQMNISGLSLSDAWAAVQQAPNLHVIPNGEYRQDFIEKLVRELETHRVLWGSFAPTFDQAFELRRIRSAAMPDTARHHVEHGNAVELFGLASVVDPTL